MTLAPGSALGPYMILAQLGHGGMGVVYTARDARLDRDVAIKVLPQELCGDATASARFRQEARAASALDHPNICTIFEINETDDGRLYLVMAYYEGETLQERIGRGPLALDEAVDLATQTAEGLSKAHAAGIVHRDIKPANLVVTADGTVKILDFGLAKLVGTEGATQTGTAVGTVAYMSPEQARGEEVDHRTDIWSLGVVLYEMLSGRPPFQGENLLALSRAILEGTPTSLLGASSPAETVVTRALHKGRSQRYPTVTSLLDALRDISGSDPQSRGDDEAPSIAVLPFANMSADPEQEYFCDGLAEELIDTLARLKGLKVVARTSAFKFKGQADDIRQIGKQLDVSTVLEGSVRKAGNRLRITAQLINVRDGYHLWSERYDRTLDDVFAVQEEIAGAIVEELKVELAPGPRASVKAATSNVEAFSLFLQARHHWLRYTALGFEQAHACLNAALKLDPDYAMAHAGVGQLLMTQSLIGTSAPHDDMPRAREAADRALSLDPGCGEARRVRGEVLSTYDWDWTGAEREYQQAIALIPNSADAHSHYSDLLARQRRPDEAIREARRGLELDPVSPDASRTLAQVLCYAGRFDEAIALSRRTLKLDPHFFPARWHLAGALGALERLDEAISVLEGGRDDSGGQSFYLALLGLHYGLVDRGAEARSLLDALQMGRNERRIPSVCCGLVCLGLGELDEAMDWLERGYRERDGLCVYLAAHLDIAPLRIRTLAEDRRIVDLLRRIGEGGRE